MNENLVIWSKFSQPPKTALKSIEAGRLKGKSDINPQWRYKAMTETFGICGIGWAYDIVNKWTEKGANDEEMCFVEIHLFIKQSNEWSRAIPAIGGSTLIAKEKNGMYNSDEAYKMATTDALGVAMKMLGVAADVYMGLWDGTKYRTQDNVALGVEQKEKSAQKPNEIITQSEWENFMNYAQEAKDKGVKIPNYDRAKMTSETINGAKKWIASQLEKAS